jgi:peptidyl-prolyl cis-trans isomerase C
MKWFFVFALSSMLLLGVPTDALRAEDAQNAKNYTVLKVDDMTVSSADVSDAWNSLFPEGAAPDFETFDEGVRQNVLKGLVSEKLLYKEALKAGIPERADIKRRLKNLETQLAIQAFIEDKASSLITEKSLKEAYDQYALKAKSEEEVRARHILVDNEEKAKEIAEKIKKGEDFAKIAKTESMDKGSGARGGDLDFFTKDKMVSSFADAAFALKKGEVSAPVKSDFGWHIIKLEDRRPAKVESFADMQEKLKADLRKKAVQQYIDSLIDKSTVEYFGADGKQKPLDLKGK